MSTHGERLAVLEATAASLDERIDNVEQAIITIRDDVHEIKEVISKYRGFAGGVIFAVSLLSGLVGAVATWAWHKLSA